MIMKSKFYLIFVILVFSGNIKAQFDEQAFFNRANSIYYNLSSSEINNFSVLITSDYFEFKTQEYINHDEFSPIQFVWINPRELHFNRTTFPENTDSLQRSNILQLQNEMFQELRGILMDWQRFLGGNLLFDLPEKYVLSTNGDTVKVIFDSFENNMPIQMKFSFGKNAVCFKIETIYKNIDQTIITYPIFTLFEKKWLCTSWRVKIMQNGIINSGFNVDLKSGKHKDYWLPIQAVIQVQTRQKINQTFTRLYKFRGLEVDKNLKSPKSN